MTVGKQVFMSNELDKKDRAAEAAALCKSAAAAGYEDKAISDIEAFKDELKKSADSEEAAVKRLSDIIYVLRAPGGCPWDREQTHESLKKPMIEEAYELIQAIENSDDENLREELGDVLLQVVFHANIAKQEGRFTLRDVANEECEKMIRRHPHVFGELSNDIDSKTVLKNWDEIKKGEKKSRSQSEAMREVPRALPALYRAFKLQAKAARTGFDWDDVSGAFDKVTEENDEIKEAAAKGDRLAVAAEVGDLLFAAVNVARMLDVDPEEALNGCSERFIRRFSHVEANRKDGMTLADLDELWEEAKLLERKNSSCERF